MLPKTHQKGKNYNNINNNTIHPNHTWHFPLFILIILKLNFGWRRMTNGAYQFQIWNSFHFKIIKFVSWKLSIECVMCHVSCVKCHFKKSTKIMMRLKFESFSSNIWIYLPIPHNRHKLAHIEQSQFDLVTFSKCNQMSIIVITSIILIK